MEHGVFRPFGMTDDEYEARLEVREQIPSLLRPTLREWAASEVADGEGPYVSKFRALAIQSALQVPIELDGKFTLADDVVEQFEDRGDRQLLWLVDYLLSQKDEPAAGYSAPIPVDLLRWHLDQTRSSLTVTAQHGMYRLTSRLPDGVEKALVMAVSDANTTAGQHLAVAIREVTTLDGNPSLAMTESIRAVEAAAGPVVTPKDARPQVSKIVGALKNKKDWGLVLQRRDDGVPDHQAVLIGMLETLVFAQRDRHSGAAPTSDQALAHMMLAATLVGWFSTGAVMML